MSNFCDEVSLESIMKYETKPTFHHYNGSQSLIDHIYSRIPSNCNVIISFKEHICKLENEENISSHDVIIGYVKFDDIVSQPTLNEKTYNYSSFCAEKVKWDTLDINSYNDQISTTFDRILNSQNSDNIPILVESFSNTLVEAAL